MDVSRIYFDPLLYLPRSDANRALFSASTDTERKRRRKSRWGAEETDKTFIPGMPTVLPTNLSKEQEEAYVCEYFPSSRFSYFLSLRIDFKFSRLPILNFAFVLCRYVGLTYYEKR